jgi:hypothetical protein
MMRLAFIHTPRTGGTTITQILARHFRLLHLNERPQIVAFLADPSAALASTDVAVGHMPFGIDRFVGEVEYAAFVRDPVDRFISTWRYARSHPSHPNFVEVRRMSLVDYLESTITFMNDNGMVRRMANYDWDEVKYNATYWWQRIPHGRITRTMLDQAKDNLRRCAFVGLFECFERDATTLFSGLGIDAGTISHENSSPGSFSPSRVELASVAARHELDMELYEFARTLRP